MLSPLPETKFYRSVVYQHPRRERPSVFIQLRGIRVGRENSRAFKNCRLCQTSSHARALNPRTACTTRFTTPDSVRRWTAKHGLTKHGPPSLTLHEDPYTLEHLTQRTRSLDSRSAWCSRALTTARVAPPHCTGSVRLYRRNQHRVGKAWRTSGALVPSLRRFGFAKVDLCDIDWPDWCDYLLFGGDSPASVALVESTAEAETSIAC